MEIRYIREFLSLAETESFFETAEQMFVTTSSLSRHIKTLEEELGVPLFDRSTRKVSLNRHGKLFLPYAREFDRIDRQCTQVFETARKEAHGTLSIGSIPMMKAYKITNLIAEFQHSNKATDISLVEADPLQLVQMLRNDEVDFAFLRETDDLEDEFVKIPYASDHLIVAVPKEHPLAECDSVSIEQLKGESLLLIGKDTFMYRLCVDLCKKAKFEPRVVFTSRRADNLIDLVIRGLGVAMLMKKPAELLTTPDVRLIDVAPTVSTTIPLAYKADRKLSNSAARFLDLVKKLER